MSMKLVPFKLKVSCDKCGGKKVAIYFCKERATSLICYGEVKKEHHHRRCETCQHEWLMEVKG